MPDDLAFLTFLTNRAPRERRLVCGMIDFNDPDTVQQTITTLAEILADSSAWHRLGVRNHCYFRTPDGALSNEPGWYLICEEPRSPLYHGQAANLNNRLNSDSGSLDNFAHSGRSTDPARNFIKALCNIGYINGLCVGVIREPEFLRLLGFSAPLEPLDRMNVEKLLGLFRNKVLGTS
jgi:hypothetical protein